MVLTSLSIVASNNRSWYSTVVQGILQDAAVFKSYFYKTGLIDITKLQYKRIKETNYLGTDASLLTIPQTGSTIGRCLWFAKSSISIEDMDELFRPEFYDFSRKWFTQLWTVHLLDYRHLIAEYSKTRNKFIFLKSLVDCKKKWSKFKSIARHRNWRSKSVIDVIRATYRYRIWSFRVYNTCQFGFKSCSRFVYAQGHIYNQ